MVVRAGIEPATHGFSVRKPDCVTQDRVAFTPTDSGHVASSVALSPETDPELAQVCAAWDKLPEAIRAGILAMVKATTE